MGQQSAPHQAVADFVVRARTTAKGSKALVRAIERESGDVYTTGAVDAWAQGRSSPPAVAVFAIAKHFHLSLDDYATGVEIVAIHRQVLEVIKRLSVHRLALDQLLADSGRRPIDYGMEAPDERQPA